MRSILVVLCLCACIAPAAIAQSIPMPYDPADWDHGSGQDSLYIGAFEVLDDIVSQYQFFTGQLFPDDAGGVGTIQMSFADGIGQQYQFALIVGRWKEHLKADLDAYLALEPPGKYADRAKELRGAITEDFCPLFVGPDEASPTTVEKLVAFYRDWLAQYVHIAHGQGDAKDKIRMHTLLRWARADGFISNGEYHQYLQDIQ